MFNLTFLNTLFLAGISAGIIPIIIHLLQRRRLKRVEFSDLRFLGPLNQQRMRSLNLRRLLLLMLRVFIIVFTALAMARPSVRGSFSRLLPTQARSSVMLLVDTSYSMRTEGESGTALDAGKAVASRLLDVMERGDQVNVMTFDDAPHALFQTPVHDLTLVRQKIQELKPSHGGTRWTEALGTALTDLGKTTDPNRELYVISDFAGVELDSMTADLSDKQRDARISFVPVGVEPFVNVSVEGAQVPPGAVLRDEPVRLAVTVRNHATDVPADCTLQVELAGQAKGEASLRLGAGAQQTQEFTLVASQAAELAGVVRKKVDRLPEDDVRYFVLPVLGQLRVLLVAGGAAAGGPGDTGGSFFLSRALSPGGEGHSPVKVDEVQATRFSSNDLDGVQVVVMSSGALLSDGQAQVLTDFVRDGGGVCVLCGQRETAEPTNRQLLERMGSARVRGVVQQQQGGFLNFADLRPTGILNGFKPDELRTLEAVKFTRYAELTAAAGTRTILRFSGQQPALVEGSYGTGKYMLFAFDAGTDGSDLAVSPMFLPLLHRTVVYLAGETGRQKLDYNVGERIEVQVPVAAPQRAEAAPVRRFDDPSALDDTRWAQAGTPDVKASPTPARDETAAERPASSAPSTPSKGARVPTGSATDDTHAFTVTTPSGHKEALVPRYVGKMAILAYENTSEPGHYTFEGGGRQLVRDVNVDTRESNLSQLSDPRDLGKKLGLKDVDKINGPDQIGRHLREARHGKELYKLIVVLVLALMTLELMLSRAARESQP